jgi:hypothetical protein
MNTSLSLSTHRLRCPCDTRSPLELRHDGGDLVLGRFCSRCDVVFDVRARLQDWMAVHLLLSILLDQAQHLLP